MRRILRVAVVVVASGLAALAAPSSAQTWPQRPVKFVVPLGPGAGADISARLLGERLTKRWGQPVVVENRPGADGVIAINAVLGARDDHTLFFGPTASIVAHPYVLDKIPYDRGDLLPVARVSSTVVVIAVPASLKVQTLKELLTMVREEPGKLNWTTVVPMTDIIVAGYLKGAGLNMAQVRYKDPVSALNDLVENRIQLYSAAYAIVRAQAQGGRVRLLAVSNRSRAPALPDLPTVAEAGFPGLTFDGLVGVIAARGSGVSDALRERIALDLKEVIADPTVTERLVATGQIVSPGTPAEFAAAIDEQAAHLAAFAKTLGISPKQ
jgi:tripartite-type tricarboxylate transporter receptor subunit TctC